MQHLRHIDWIYCKYCIYQNGRNLQFIVEKGGSVGGNGINIPLNNNEEVTMFGNKVGVKEVLQFIFMMKKANQQELGKYNKELLNG